MTLPMPRKSTAAHFYKYRGPANLAWLKDTIHKHEIYLPNLRELNDDNDGLPHLAMQTEQEMADFLYDRFQRANPLMAPEELARHEAIIRYNVRLHGPAALHPNLVELMDAQLKDFRVYSMTQRYDMGNLWALYADNHRGCCLEFQNVGPLFEYAKDVTYLGLKEMEVEITDPGILRGDFLFCKTREWRCEEEVRVVLSRIDGRSKVQFDPTWLTRIILGRAMSEENKEEIRAWAKERQPELKVVTTYYDPTARAIKLKEDVPQKPLFVKGKGFMTNLGPTFGNSEFTRTVRTAFSRLFEVLPRAIGALNELTSRERPNMAARQDVIINLGILLGISMLELVTLAESGFGQGAMKIARTVMETAINAEYLRQFPSEFEQYVDWYLVEKYKELAYVRAHMPEVLQSIDPASITTIEAEFEKIKLSFRKPNGDLRSSWCSLNLPDRAAKVGFADAYKLINPLSSVFIHATVGGLARHFETENNEDRISVPPSLRYCAEALSGGHLCLCKMIETVSKALDRTPVHSIESLAHDFEYAWATPKLDRN